MDRHFGVDPVMIPLQTGPVRLQTYGADPLTCCVNYIHGRLIQSFMTPSATDPLSLGMGQAFSGHNFLFKGISGGCQRVELVQNSNGSEEKRYDIF